MDRIATIQHSGSAGASIGLLADMKLLGSALALCGDGLGVIDLA
ncbi:hypothetical protein [Paraburkholderia tropica]|nr:hypothetical protein [Paraburkholderia tropica]